MTASYQTPFEVLEAAKEAAIAKSAEIWERDGKQDCGSCGGAVLMLKGGRKFSKLAIQTGLAEDMGGRIFVSVPLAPGIKSQNADIYQGAARAFRDVIVAGGYGEAIKKFWTYID